MDTPAKRPLYRIRDWETHYEVSQSKRAERPEKLSWVAIPNKHDGKGFRRVSRQPDATDLFAAWILLLEVASKCSPRGSLIDSDGPMTPLDLADKTGFPETIFARAYSFFTDTANGVQWLEIETNTATLGAHSEQPRSTPGAHSSIQDRTGHDRTGQDTTRQDKPKEASPITPPAAPPATGPSGKGARGTDYTTAPIPTVQDYSDLRKGDPILVAIAITGERFKRSWGHWVKLLNQAKRTMEPALAVGLFQNALERTWGEIKAGEAKKPGAILNMRLHETFGDATK